VDEDFGFYIDDGNILCEGEQCQYSYSLHGFTSLSNVVDSVNNHIKCDHSGVGMFTLAYQELDMDD